MTKDYSCDHFCSANFLKENFCRHVSPPGQPSTTATTTKTTEQANMQLYQAKQQTARTSTSIMTISNDTFDKIKLRMQQLLMDF